MEYLLAVDLGVKTGLALYGNDGRVIWYRSQNFGKAARLKRAIPSLISEIEGLKYIVLEGGGAIYEIWERAAHFHQLETFQVAAEEWRKLFLYQREQKSGSEAKRFAENMAYRVIEWSKAKRPTSLKHDAAEAILVGLWGALKVGWLKEECLKEENFRG